MLFFHDLISLAKSTVFYTKPLIMKARTFLFCLFLLLLIPSSFAKSSKVIAEIPFEFYNNYIFLKVKVNDKKVYNFIFDTGAGIHVVDKAVAQQLNLKAYSQLTSTGAGGKTTSSLFANLRLSMQNISITQSAIELDTRHLSEKIGRNIDGILGNGLMQKYVVQILYDAEILRIYEKESFEYTVDNLLVRRPRAGRRRSCRKTVRTTHGAARRVPSGPPDAELEDEPTR